jgi:hypothetical protein
VSSIPKLRDKLAYVPPERLNQWLQERGRALHDIPSQRMEKTARTELRIALQGLVHRMGMELERLALDPHDTENAARAVRNCLETNLIGRYVLASNDNVRNWLSLRAQEEIDVLSSLLRVLARDSHSAEHEQLEGRIRDLQTLLAKHDMPKAVRLPRWRHLAIEYHLQDDYDALYGLFSKYVHPSAWLIVKPDDGWATTFTKTFVIHAQLYAADLTMRALAALGLDDSVMGSGPWGAAQLH